MTLLVGLVLGACSDNDRGDASPSTTTSTSATTSTSTTSTTVDAAAQAEAEVVAAYEAASRAFIDAAAIPDPNYPALATTHTGPMLDQRRRVLLALQADGRVIRYPPNSQYRVEVDQNTLTLEGDVAIFEVCGVDDGERVVAATGEVVAGGLVTVQARVAMQRVNGAWALAERQQISELQGVAGCALE
jgi:hypothetical protein